MSALATARLAADDPLARHSIEVLKRGQARTGAFIASPAFPVYGFAWLRDGAFCAAALDVIGERAGARAFHQWVIRSIEAHRPMIESAIERLAEGETLPSEAMPPARYTLEGTLERQDDEPWPNFQIDGYGMWLWALEEHLSAEPDALSRPTVDLIARYLEASWRLKCFNCWEEFDGGEHASTLGAAVAGLNAAARLLDVGDYAAAAACARERLLESFLADSRFKRGVDDDRLDGSLLWLAVPFGVLEPTDRRMAATVEAIRRDLRGPNGGVYRYRGDTYYGGGEWLLLTSSLAWHDAVSGNPGGYDEAQTWVRAQARPNCDLPEQVSEHAQEPEMVKPWLRRWGPVATPLLWSHAMFLLAEAAAANHA